MVHFKTNETDTSLGAHDHGKEPSVLYTTIMPCFVPSVDSSFQFFSSHERGNELKYIVPRNILCITDNSHPSKEAWGMGSLINRPIKWIEQTNTWIHEYMNTIQCARGLVCFGSIFGWFTPLFRVGSTHSVDGVLWKKKLAIGCVDRMVGRNDRRLYLPFRQLFIRSNNIMPRRARTTKQPKSNASTIHVDLSSLTLDTVVG